jgi:hypothetical protein
MMTMRAPAEGVTWSNGRFRYKGQIWPHVGAVCHRCKLITNYSISTGFGKQMPYTWCRQCKRTVVRTRRSSRMGYLQYLACQMKIRARNQGRKCSIDYPFLELLWCQQEGRCALTGMSMCHTYARSNSQRLLLNASVDRIDSDIGYIPDNVQLVGVRLNLMKGAVNQKTFFDLCRIVCNYEPYYK